MHYEELASILEASTGDIIGLDLARALRDGAGYVLITLEPDGLKVTAASVPGSSGQTIRAKKTMRTLVHQINSGRANGPTS